MRTVESYIERKAFDIDLMQKEVDGGRITREQIDTIASFPEAKTIQISGLDQDTFEYFVDTYAERFTTISFWKNKRVKDLSKLSKLHNVEYLRFFHNQHVKGLWDLSSNTKLRILALYDMTKLRSISGIEKAPALEVFDLGNYVWGTMEIDSLKPLLNSTVKCFAWYGKKVRDGDLLCLSRSRIEVLDMNISKLTMGELARLLAAFPEDLEGTVTLPYIECTIQEKGDFTTFRYLCKFKGECIKGRDDARFEEYLETFRKMLAKEREKNGRRK